MMRPPAPPMPPGGPSGTSRPRQGPPPGGRPPAGPNAPMMMRDLSASPNDLAAYEQSGEHLETPPEGEFRDKDWITRGNGSG